MPSHLSRPYGLSVPSYRKGEVAIPMCPYSIMPLNTHILGALRHFSGFALKLPLLGAKTSNLKDLRSLSRPSAASVPVRLTGLGPVLFPKGEP